MADKTKNILIHIKGKVDDFNKKYDSVTKKADALKQKFQQIAKIIAGAYVAGRIINSIKAIIKETIEWGVQVDRLQKSTGLTVEAVQRLAYAADQEHASLEMLEKVFPKLVQSMDYASKGGNLYAQAMENIGLKATDTEGNLRPVMDVFLDLSDIMADKTIPHETKLAAITNVLGIRYARMLPLLEKGSEWFREIGDEAERLGMVLSKDMIDALKEADDELLKFKTAQKGLRIQIGVKLLPVVRTLTKHYTDLMMITDKLTWKNKSLADKFDFLLRSILPFAHLLPGMGDKLREINEELAEYRKETELLKLPSIYGPPKPFYGPPEPPKKKEDDLTKAGKEKIKIIKEMEKEWEDWERIQMVPSIPIPKTMGFEPWTSKLKKDTEEVKEEMIDLTEEVKEEVMDLEGVFSSLGSVMGKVLKGGKLEMGDFLSVLLGFLPAGSIWGKFLPFGKGGMTAIPRAAEGMVTKVNKPTITPHGVMAGDKYQTEWIFTGDQLTAYTKALKTTIVVHNAHPDTVVEEIGGLSESGQYNLQRILNNNILSKGKKLNR